MERKIYIAYGSNMDPDQMAYRCPEALYLCSGYIEGYRLMFKGSLTGSYATIEKDPEHYVPVCIWEITKDDEKALDHYEGYPRFYIKKELPVRSEQGTIKGMAYIMTKGRKLGVPSGRYYENIKKEYQEHGFDVQLLRDALNYSVKMIDK